MVEKDLTSPLRAGEVSQPRLLWWMVEKDLTSLVEYVIIILICVYTGSA